MASWDQRQVSGLLAKWLLPEEPSCWLWIFLLCKISNVQERTEIQWISLISSYQPIVNCKTCDWFYFWVLPLSALLCLRFTIVKPHGQNTFKGWLVCTSCYMCTCRVCWWHEGVRPFPFPFPPSSPHCPPQSLVLSSPCRGWALGPGPCFIHASRACFHLTTDSKTFYLKLICRSFLLVFNLEYSY